VSADTPAAILLPRRLPTSSSFAWGLVFCIFALFLAPLHAAPAALTLLAGAGLIARDVRRRRIGDASQLLAASFRAVSVGHLAEAEVFLDAADKSRLPWSRRIADVQRAIVHLRRGDPTLALARLDAALARPVGRYARENALYQIEAALALRAFTRASLGDADGARHDIAAVRSRGGVSAESLARAALAEAMLLERTGGRDALRALLDRDKGLLLESCHPRERAIVRAYQRMVRVTTTSAYRASAPRDDADAHPRDEPALLDWVTKLVPAAAPFVRAPRAHTGPAGPHVALLPRVDVNASPTVLRDRAATAAIVGKRSTRLRALAVTSGVAASVVGVVAVIAALASAMPDAHDLAAPIDAPAALPSASIPFTPLALFAVAAALAFAAFRASRRVRHSSNEERGRLGMARDAIGRGDLDAAAAALRGLEGHEHDRLAAHASALQATIAERRCDAAGMLAAASTGLGRLAHVHEGDAFSIQPELIGQRALALTLLDRGDEAAAELGILAHRTSPMRERDLFRVRLIGLARRGQLAEAARWIEQEAGDLPLGVRDELLADLVRAAAAPEAAGLGEIERLEHELRTEPEHRRWIEWAAPAALRRFRAANEDDDGDGGAGEAKAERVGAPLRVGVRVVEPGIEAEVEAEAETETDGTLGRRGPKVARW
jgi:hypothetical protein